MRVKGGTQLPRNHTFLAVKAQANLLFQPTTFGRNLNV